MPTRSSRVAPPPEEPEDARARAPEWSTAPCAAKARGSPFSQVMPDASAVECVTVGDLPPVTQLESERGIRANSIGPETSVRTVGSPSPARVALQLTSTPKEVEAADKPLHLSLVKELLGEGIRDMLRAELKHVNTSQKRQVTYDKPMRLLRAFSSPHVGEHPRAQCLACLAKQLSSESVDGSRAATTPAMAQPQREAVACDAANGQTSASRTAEKVEGVSSQASSEANAKRDLFLHGGRGHFHEISTKGNIINDVLPRSISGVIKQFGQEAPPHLGGRLREFVESKTVESITISVVLLNCLFMIHSVNYECRHGSSSPSTFIVVAEAAFFVFYSLELVCKLLCYRCWFFTGDGARLNWLDFLLVIVNGLSVLDLAHASSSPADVSMQQFKLLRLLKLFRVARVVTVLHSFKVLRVLMGLFSRCWWILFWSLVMWILILFMCSVFFAQRYATFCDVAEPEHCRELTAYFGSVQASMLTMFSATNGGMDWMDVWHLLEPTGSLNLFAYLCSVLFLQIAVVNIVIGLFVESAVQSTVKSRETLALERAKQDLEAKKDLAKLFQDFGDLDAGGYLSREEWDAAMQRSEVHSFMEIMGLRPMDVIEYFDILMSSSENQEVSISELVDGCTLLKGSASHFDTLRVMAEINEAVSTITATFPDAGKQAVFTAHCMDVLS